MQFRLSALFITVILLFPASADLFAARAGQNEWSSVQSVPTGTELVLKRKDGRTIKGRLAGVSETIISVSDKARSIDVQRGEIHRVYTLKGKSRARSALLGAGTGAGIGVGAGLILYLPARDDIVGMLVPAFGALGAGIGAGIGALVGGGRKQVLIYEAK